MTKRGDQVRAEILAVLRDAEGAMSAYEVLRQLKTKHPKIAPPTVYTACGTVEERTAPHLVDNISGRVGETGFLPHRHVIEIHGVCSSCSAET